MYSALLQMVRLILRERDAGLRVQEAARPKVCKRTKRHKTSQLHVVLGCEYLLYLLRLNDMYSIELSF